MGKFFKDVFFNVLTVVSIAIIPPLIIRYAMPEGLLRFCVNTITSIVTLAASIYAIGCSANERNMVKDKVSIIGNKLFRR